MSRRRRKRGKLTSFRFVLFLLAVGLSGCDDVEKAAELRAAEPVGEVAAKRLASVGETERSAADLINVPVEVRKLADFVYQARGVSNTHVIATSEGNVVFDTGLAIQSAKQPRSEAPRVGKECRYRWSPDH